MAKEIMQYFKPTIDCLMLHQSEWSEKIIVTNNSRIPSILCEYCNRFFKYPTNRNEEPIYRKFNNG